MTVRIADLKPGKLYRYAADPARGLSLNYPICLRETESPCYQQQSTLLTTEKLSNEIFVLLSLSPWGGSYPDAFMVKVMSSQGLVGWLITNEEEWEEATP